jgi:hypothetical protein
MELEDLTLLVTNPMVDDYVSEIKKRVSDLKIISSQLMHEYDEEIEADVSEVDIIEASEMVPVSSCRCKPYFG